MISNIIVTLHVIIIRTIIIIMCRYAPHDQQCVQRYYASLRNFFCGHPIYILKNADKIMIIMIIILFITDRTRYTASASPAKPFLIIKTRVTRLRKASSVDLFRVGMSAIDIRQDCCSRCILIKYLL